MHNSECVWCNRSKQNLISIDKYKKTIVIIYTSNSQRSERALDMTVQGEEWSSKYGILETKDLSINISNVSLSQQRFYRN